MYAVKTEELGKLYVMPKPSGEWLTDDIAHYKIIGITDIVSLLRDDEVEELGLRMEPDACIAVGIEFERLPIKDRGLPDIVSLRNLAERTTERISNGSSVAVHCRARIGRAGLLACCVQQELGFSAEQSLTDVSNARGVQVPDTTEQRDFILSYSNS